jgi:cell division protein FtsI (penicillin-binding protein 3)
MSTVFAPVRLPLAWRWLGSGVWRLEHAFARARAAAAPQDTRLRIAFVGLIFSIAFAVLAVGAARQALFSGRGGEAGAAAPPDSRADLTDRNGAMLAVDLPHFSLYIDPREVWDLPATRDALRLLLPDMPAKRIDKILTGDKRAFLVGGLTPEQRGRLHDLGLPGLSFEDDERRVYPLGPTASHLIGFSDSGGAGIAGVERAFDKTIRGGPGGPVPLSIDLRVQSALEDELRKTKELHSAIAAVGIVTNVRTGEILALASLPDYDPNNPSIASPEALTNRAAARVFEMGSTFKIFTVAAGLDSGTVNMNSTFNVAAPLKIGGQTIHDYDKGDTVLDLSHVLLHSSNIGAAKIALATGADTMTRYYRELGLFAPAKVELTESTRPLLPAKWTDNALASASFGNAIAVSPLAVAAGMGAVLNGGTYVPLTLHKLGPGQAPKGQRVFSEETSRRMLTMLRDNVTSGTGGKADAPGLRVGGKTGSNEKVINGRIERKLLLTSFAAGFPVDGPLTGDRYFVLILMDEPKGIPQTFGFATGGWTAAPAAGRVIDRIAPFLGVKRAPVVKAKTPAEAAAALTAAGAEVDR